MRICLLPSLIVLCLHLTVWAETRTIRDGDTVYSVTVTAPKGKTVDARAWYGLGETADEVMAASLEREPLDITGYFFRIAMDPTAPQVKCNSIFKFKKPIPTQLAAGGSVDVSCDFCESMDVTVFPTIGDVNVIIGDSNGRTCTRSNRPKNRLDATGCYYPGCVNSSTILITTIYNKSQTEAATFVGTVGVFFIQP